MFSAFKKLANRNEVQNGQNGAQVSPGGVQSMASNLQKKFSKVRIPLSFLFLLFILYVQEVVTHFKE